MQSLDDAGVRHALPPAALLQSAHTLAEAGQAVAVSACKDVLCPFSQQTEQDLLLWTADHGSCPDSVQACESQSNSHGCLVHQSFLGAAVHVCTGSMHCRAQPNYTDPATRDPDSPEARSHTPLLEHANGTHPNQCRPCFLLFHANNTLFLRPNILDEQQSKENPKTQKRKKTKKEVGKPNDLPLLKKHKSTDSDEDDEEPQIQPGTSSTPQPFVPVLLLNQGPAASPQGPATSDDENSECGDEYCARSQDSGKTLLYPDLKTLTNDEHWTVTPETNKYAAAAESFCFVTAETREQQDTNNLTTMPSVQRSLCLKEVTDNSGSTRVEIPNGVDNQTRNMLETLHGNLWGSRRSKSPKAVSCTKRSVSPGSTRILQAVC